MDSTVWLQVRPIQIIVDAIPRMPTHSGLPPEVPLEHKTSGNNLFCPDRIKEKTRAL